MEANDNQQRSVYTSSDCQDGEPTAVRRRLDLEGSFSPTDHNKTGNLSASETRKINTSGTSLDKESMDKHGANESLLAVTLTSQQECDKSPSPMTSHSSLCRTVSHGDLYVTGVEQVEVSHNNSASHEMDKSDSVPLNTVSARMTPSGVLSNEGKLPSSPSYIPPAEVTPQIHQQETKAVTSVTDHWKSHKATRNSNREDGSKDSSETDATLTNSSSGGSSSSFYGLTDETENTGSSTDITELYDNAEEAIEMEKLREEERTNIISSCLDMVSSKIGQLQEIAAKVLISYGVPDDETVISERVDVGMSSAATGVPSSQHTPNDEAGHSAASECTSDGRNISCEDGAICEQRFVTVKDYVLSVNSIYERENESGSDTEDQWRVMCEMVKDREATAASRALSASVGGDDVASTKAQLETSYGTASNRSQVGGQCPADSDKDYVKKLRNTYKTACKSRRIVSRQHEILSHTSAAAEQRVRKMTDTGFAILDCLKCSVIVVNTALEAKRVAQLCVKEAMAMVGNRVCEVARAAISTSRFAREAVKFSERAMNLHKEAAEALGVAKASLDQIQVEEAKARDLWRQMSAFVDEVDKMIQQTSRMSLEKLEGKKCFVLTSRGNLSLVLKKVKKKSMSIENVTDRCDKVLTETLQALQMATISSVNAIYAALKALQTFRGGS